MSLTLDENRVTIPDMKLINTKLKATIPEIKKGINNNMM